MANMLEAALQYLHAGYSVIPIRKGDKKPALTSWLEYGDRLPTEDEITEWFYHKDVNIGIVTGKVSNTVVLDIDDPKQYPVVMAKYPTGKVVQTPSGGFHLYYTYDGTDIKNSVKAVLPGVDVRGYHGYVVAPPSEGYKSFAAPLKYATAVTPALKKLIQDATRYDVQIAQPGPVNNDRDAATLYDRVVKSGFTSGAHNQELKDVARYMYRMGENESVIISTMAILNAKDPTPLPEMEMLKTIKSGLDYERNRIAGKLSPDAREYADIIEGKRDHQLTALEKRKEKINKFDAVSWGEVAADFQEAADKWLIKDWLPDSAIMVTAAPPESYKTWIGLEAGINVAFGDRATPFLGFATGNKEPAPVLIVQQEDYMGLLTDRIQTIIATKTSKSSYPYLELDVTDGEPGDKFISYGSVFDAPLMLHTKSGLSFEDDDSIAGLEERIKQYGIKYVMIDPFYMLGRADDYYASLAIKMGAIKQLRDKYNTTFMFIHHNRKGTKNAKAADVGEREKMFGSQLLNGAFEGFWLLDEAEDKKRIITRRGKVFAGAQDKYLLEFDIQTGSPLPKNKYVAFNYIDRVDGTDVARTQWVVDDQEFMDDRRYNIHTSLLIPMDYTDQEQLVMDLAVDLTELTRPDVQKALEITSPAAGRILDKLVGAGALQIVNEGKKGQGVIYALARAY